MRRDRVLGCCGQELRNGTANTYTWNQANGLTGTFNFAGKTDWRLPNIRELTTIVDLSVSSPSIDDAIFPSTPPFTTSSAPTSFGSNFWTDSALAPDPSLGWVIDFYYGGTVAYLKTLTFYARLLQWGGLSTALLGTYRSSTDYKDNQDGTVTHAPTGLVWKRCAEGQNWSGNSCTGFGNSYTWSEANALRGTVSFAGRTDWRLPDRAELLSLVDYTQSSPAINSTAFPLTSSSRFWSLSGYAPNPSYAWFVYFHQGDTYALRKDDAYNVRLVRNSDTLVQVIANISFSPPSLSVGGNTTASTTASSGLPIAFSSTTPSVCTVNGSTVTGVSAGTCTVAANQAGNASYASASQVTQNITVTPTLFMVTTTAIPSSVARSSAHQTRFPLEAIIPVQP